MNNKEVIEKMKDKQQEHFDILHSKELKEIVKNFSEEDRRDALAVLPSSMIINEIRRRESYLLDCIHELMSILSRVYGANLSVEDMEKIISECRKVLRIKEDELRD